MHTPGTKELYAWLSMHISSQLSSIYQQRKSTHQLRHLATLLIESDNCQPCI